MLAHLTDTFLNDPFHGAAPSGMKNPDSSPFPVRQNDRKAIRCLNGQDQTRRICDQTVPGQELRGDSVNSMD
jgi:hypothetical protein